MHNKKALGVFLLFCFLATPVVHAKDKEQAQKPLTADAIVAKMKFQLELTDDQAQKVKPIIENYMDQEKQLKREEAKELRTVLTGDQMFTWNFLQDEQPTKSKKKK